MRQKPFVPVLASIGLTAAMLAVLQPSAAQEQASVTAQVIIGQVVAGQVATAQVVAAQVVAAQVVASSPQVPHPAIRTVSDFFRDFTAEWIRRDPDLARRTRYFADEEQDQLERQLTPRTEAWKRARLQLSRRGLAELQTFDRASMSDEQRLSADLMRWQLQVIVDEEPFLDETFPLNQFRGENRAIVDTLVVTHPLRVERDAENYVAALGQVSARMEEATAEAHRLAAKGILPPDFIIRATIEQMQRFIATAPAQNPFVAIFAQKMAAIASLPEEKRAQLRSQAQ